MSWSYSRALVEEFSAQCLSDTGLSALLSTTPTPDQSYWPDKTTEHSRLSRFGMTYGLLTGIRGEELLTWYLEASRAKTLALPEAGPDWTAKGQGCGEKWLGLLGKYDPVSCSLKTAQLSLLEDSTGCCPTLPRWGLLAVGASLEPVMSGRNTAENEYGYSGASNGKQDAKAHQGKSDLILSAMWKRDEKRSISIWSIDGLGPIYEAEILLDGLPECFFSERGTKEPSEQMAFSLSEKGMLRALFLAKEFASASHRQGHIEQLPDEFADTLRKLSQQVALEGAEGSWKVELNGELYPQPMLEPFTAEKEFGFLRIPTPTVYDASGMGSLRKDCNIQEGGRHGVSLHHFVAMWPTPTASASKGSSQNSLTRKDGRDRSGDRLDHAVMALENGRLNPEFCEWLMGWPIGQTELRPLGMDKYQEWRQQHSPCFTETKEADAA